MAHGPDETCVGNYDIKSIKVNDHNEANCYTVVDNCLYYTCLGNFKKRDLITFKYMIGGDGWASEFSNTHQYNKFNKSIFMMGDHANYIQCFNTIDQTFSPLYYGISDGHFNYGISEDGKVIYVLDGDRLYKIDAITKKVEPMQKPALSCSLTYYAAITFNSRLIVTNSGKIIHFSIYKGLHKYINIYDPNSKETVSNEINYFGKLNYSENDQKIIISHDLIGLKNYIIYDMNLNVKCEHIAALYSSNFYNVDYNNYKLNEDDIDGNNISSINLDEVKEDYTTNSNENKETSFGVHVNKVEDMIIISNPRYRFLYQQDGKYLGRVPMQYHSFINSPIHFSSDRKHLIELNPKCIYNYDITCLQHREQKTKMLASAPYFTKDPLFDRNLLPLIFDFLPKPD